MRGFATGHLLRRDMMLWYWNCYTPEAKEAFNPLASVLRATDLKRLPSATVITAEFDPLRDEAEQYADRLRSAGVPVTGRRYGGMIHGFLSLPHITPVARRGLMDAAMDIRDALAVDS
ncbi:MAG: alpha/beta hydrolase fold domain-containing protein [Proteobacteria bacterium]|nr:alpha/beta hydrolase fold domain-containing protein [Pseudomonadota bacterium]